MEFSMTPRKLSLRLRIVNICSIAGDLRSDYVTCSGVHPLGELKHALQVELASQSPVLLLTDTMHPSCHES